MCVASLFGLVDFWSACMCVCAGSGVGCACVIVIRADHEASQMPHSGLWLVVVSSTVCAGLAFGRRVVTLDVWRVTWFWSAWLMAAVEKPAEAALCLGDEDGEGRERWVRTGRSGVIHLAINLHAAAAACSGTQAQ